MTDPPSAYPLILCKFLEPTALAAFLLTTNSPGVNNAGTLSVLPDPGTGPPLANFLTTPPRFKVGPLGGKLDKLLFNDVISFNSCVITPLPRLSMEAVRGLIAVVRLLRADVVLLRAVLLSVYESAIC